MKKRALRLGAIDIGSNSIRLLVADFDGEKFSNKMKEKATTRLRGDVKADNSLDEDRIEKSVEAVSSFIRKAKDLGAVDIVIYATSAVREAPNRSVLIDKIKYHTSYDVEVLTGEEEARLGFMAAVKNLSSKLKLGDVKYLTLDVGGGSTELCLGSETEIDFIKSYKIGVVALQEDYFKESDLLGMNSARQLIENEIGDDFDILIDKLPFYPILLGGTATTIGMHGLYTNIYNEEELNGLDVGIKEIKAMLDEVLITPEEYRKNIVGVSEDRAKILLQGLIIIEFILSALGQKLVFISESDSLEGALLKRWKLR